ncbi:MULTISPECIES: helix-turn-helix domain-containing protein [unclassified Streptomyces]|uniref:winged helix-turn-helix transcriptional regulator n=1 Tax=unclassified Streptomyces TaxID=2593676 RepID=UPI0021E37E2C|nr:helix-turn-helix domain-containing protein [Streptomyces sp. ICN988]MCV2461558.1 helix-turn-helix transcriptional regulator [Streptomyces sp. ICN988]
MTPSSTSRASHSPNDDIDSARGDLFDPQCPTRRLLDRIGTKWTSMAVKVLAEASPEEVRFAELQRRMAGISQKMLSVTLQGLARDGLVGRRVEATVPPRVYYRLTPLGLTLEEPLAALREWAEEHMAEVDRAHRRSREDAASSD